MRDRLQSAVFAGLAVVLFAAGARAQMPGPNLALPPAPLNDTQQQAALFTAPPVVIDDRIAFNTSERWIIPTFYQQVREKQKRAARSKKYDRVLPAGLSRAPAQGDLLPLTVLAGLDRLPGPLLRDLPPARPNTDRVLVGKDVVMVNTATGEVLDILPGILF